MRLKNARQKLWFDAPSIVAHYDLSAVRFHENRMSAGFSGVHEKIHQHALPSRGVALHSKTGIHLLAEIQFRSVNTLQVILRELNGTVDNRRQFGAGAIRIQDAAHDALTAVDAAQQGEGGLRPVWIGPE